MHNIGQQSHSAVLTCLSSVACWPGVGDARHSFILKHWSLPNTTFSTCLRPVHCTASSHDLTSEQRLPLYLATASILACTFVSEYPTLRWYMQVLSIKTKADEQLVQLQAQHQEVQSLQQKLQSAVTDKAASERSLSEQSVRSRNELAEQHDTVKKLQEQLTDAQTKLSQVQSDRAEEERQAGAQKEAASKQRQEVSELQAQLTKAQEEVASFADIRIHLQQQLGERTIVLGQKAHQIAHLTAQLNEARALSRSSHGLGECECFLRMAFPFRPMWHLHLPCCIIVPRHCCRVPCL